MLFLYTLENAVSQAHGFHQQWTNSTYLARDYVRGKRGDRGAKTWDFGLQVRDERCIGEYENGTFIEHL